MLKIALTPEWIWVGRERKESMELAKKTLFQVGGDSQVDLVVPVDMEDEDGLEGSLEVEGIGLLIDGQ